MLTPQFLFDLESRMQVIANEEYQRLVATGNQWWRLVAREQPSNALNERKIFSLDTATIQDAGTSGAQVEFDELMTRTFQYTNRAATGGLKLNRFQLEDLDGGGIDQAAQWSRQVSAYAAYWPQKSVAKYIRMGGAATSLGYDGVPYFGTNHPLNPFATNLGNYANDFTGASSGNYPGACPIDNSVSLDTAFVNLQKVITYVAGMRMPNGVDPRYLRVAKMIVPPGMTARAQQLLNAKFIAQTASSGAGSADVEAIVSGWGLGQPVQADELGAANTEGAAGSDNTYYLLAEQMAGDTLGAIGYSNREAFQIIYNDQMTDAQLNRMNELLWTIRGRNVVYAGHPYLLFRCQGS